MQCLAILLVSHTTGLSFEKTTDVLKKFDTELLSLKQVRLISANLLEFLMVGSGKDDSSTRMTQCNQTPNLVNFERVAFQKRKRICTCSLSHRNI